MIASLELSVVVCHSVVVDPSVRPSVVDPAVVDSSTDASVEVVPPLVGG